jgi:septum formation protein
MDNIKLILASKSPRRQALINELGYPVEIRIKEVEEIYPDSIAAEDVPVFLAKLKAGPLLNDLDQGELLITSDTIVVLDGEVIGKPTDEKNAIELLQNLSGRTHRVITGVSIHSTSKSFSFQTETKVHFSNLSPAEISHYVHQNKPLDKAGAYGIQEWIGYIGVEKIEGCYYNVMGLPLHDLYKALKLEFGVTVV